MAEDGVVAGKLEIPVEADTAGFGKKLEAAIKRQTENIAAKIGVELDEDGLRKRLEATVDAAAKGVKAHVDVVVDTKKAKAELEKLGSKVNVKVEGLSDDVKRQSLLARIFARKNPIEFPARVEKKGFFASLLAAKAEGEGALAKNPVRIPFALPENFRSTMMPLFYLAIASVIQPAIAAIVGALGGAAGMLANLSAAVNVLAGAPAVIGAAVGGAMLLQNAFQQLGGDVKDLPPALKKAKNELDAFVKVSGKGKEMWAIAFWKQVNGELLTFGKQMMPVVNKGLESMSATTGTIFRDLLKWGSTELVKGQVERAIGSADSVLGHMGKSVIGVLQGFLNIVDSASMLAGNGKKSLIDRINSGLDRMTAWASNIAKPGSGAQKFADMLSYGADKASQLWEVLKDLGAGVVGIFKAGRESSDELLDSFVKTIDKWRGWVDSDMGQKKIKDWFAAVKPITVEAGKLIADIGKAVIRMAGDPNVSTMLKRIREELLPTLEKFLTNLGKTLGPEVIDFFTNLLSILSDMSEAGGPLAKGLGLINDVLTKLSDWLRQNPDVAAKLGTILGALLAFRALAFIANVTGGLKLLTAGLTALGGAGIVGLTAAILPFTGALNGLSPALQGAIAAVGTFMTIRATLPAAAGIISKVSDALFAVKYHAVLAADGFRAASDKFKATGSSGFGAAAKAVGTTASSGLRGALSGIGTLIGGAAMGGPVGLAISAAAVGVGIWAQKHAEASAKAAEYKSWVEQLAGTLDKETGALTEATRAAVANKLIHEGVDSTARKLGVSLKDLTDASMGNADAASRVRKELADNLKQMILNDTGSEKFKKSLDAAGVSLDAFALAQISGGKTAQDMRSKVLNAATANQIHGFELDSLWAKLEKNTKAHQDLAGRVGNEAQAVKDATNRQATYNEMMGKGSAAVQAVIDKVRALPANKSITVKSLTSDATTALERLGYKVQRMPNGTVRITATSYTAAAERNLNWVARNRTAHISASVSYTGQGTSYAGGVWKDGGILQFAEGGIRDRIKAFANGAEKHIAQIARPGEWRLWAEPETGGEAYIPLSPSKRKRSMEILREVADRFGMALAPKFAGLASAMQDQGSGMSRIAQYAAGAVRSSDLHAAALGGPRFVFEAGAIVVQNPVAETPSESVSKVTRRVGEFGLWGDNG